MICLNVPSLKTTTKLFNFIQLPADNKPQLAQVNRKMKLTLAKLVMYFSNRKSTKQQEQQIIVN